MCLVVVIITDQQRSGVVYSYEGVCLSVYLSDDNIIILHLYCICFMYLLYESYQRYTKKKEKNEKCNKRKVKMRFINSSQQFAYLTDN